MLQAFAVTFYGESLASNTLVALYAMFSVACLFAPAVTNILGPRRTLGVGVLSYVPIPVSTLLFVTYGTDGCRTLVVLAGAISGAGGACMWTAQGRLMLEAASVSGDPATSFGIFWAFFSTAAIAGGLLTFVFYSLEELDQGSSPILEPPRGLFYVYIALMLSAAALSTCVRGSGGGAGSGESCTAQATWNEEAWHTLKMSTDPRMLRLAPIFFYSGFNQPYQLDTFGNRFFTARLLGLELSIFYLLEAVGGAVAGRMLDRHTSVREKQTAARRTLALFLSLNTGAAGLALWHELRAVDPGGAQPLDVGSADSITATLAFALWGFADSQIQGYIYWLLPHFFEGGATQAHSISLYKMMQALGWMIGFCLYRQIGWHHSRSL